MNGIKKKLIGFSVLSLMAAFSSQAQASGYKLEFQSPSVLADGGDAAVVEDASTNWYNSAGLVYLPQQLTLSSFDVYQQIQFSGTTTAFYPPGSIYYNPTAKASSYPNSILPAFHYALPFKERYAVGISVAPAWGLAEDYGESSSVRYSLNHISTKTLDISPSFAAKLDDKFSIGLGPDFHYFYIQNRVHAFNPPFPDSVARYSGDDWGTGWHAGVLYRATDATRIGVNYRSKIVMHLTGDSDFSGGFSTNQFAVNIPLPPTTSISIYHDFTPAWALMGTIAYDQWSVIKSYVGQNIMTPFGPTTVALPQNFNNTFDFSLGTHLKVCEKLMLRGSLKYQNTPTNNTNRGLAFPDAPKLGVNVGGRYTINKKLAVDMIYAHVFVQNVRINDVNPLTGATAVGYNKTDINLLGAQLVWDI
jgi:long-chain fatty acid transport protein